MSKNRKEKAKERTAEERWAYLRSRLGQMVMTTAVDAAGDTILERVEYYPRMTRIEPESVDRAFDEAIDRAEEAAGVAR